MASIFTRIIQGEIPSYRVAEDEHHFAFLDINPLKKGHTLIVPKKEVDYIFDLEPEDLAELMKFGRRVGRAIEQVVPCERIGIAVIGLEVPHAHVHLVPIEGVQDIDFSKPRVEMSSEEYTDLAQRIFDAFAFHEI